MDASARRRHARSRTALPPGAAQGEFSVEAPEPSGLKRSNSAPSREAMLRSSGRGLAKFGSSDIEGAAKPDKDGQLRDAYGFRVETVDESHEGGEDQGGPTFSSRTEAEMERWEKERKEQRARQHKAWRSYLKSLGAGGLSAIDPVFLQRWRHYTGQQSCEDEQEEESRQRAKGSLALEGLHFVNGVAPSYGGGAIQIDSGGTLRSVDDCKFGQNRAEEYSGGAIRADSATIGVIKHAVFEQNSAEYSGGGIVLSCSSIEAIVDSSFIQNSADTGGAVYLWDSEIKTISGSIFKGNAAIQYGGGAIVAALLSEPCQKSVGSTVGVIKNTTFLSNSARGRGGAVWNSAYLYSPRTTGSTTLGLIVDSTFERNKAGRGGALNNFDSGAITSRISNSSFLDNTAKDFGGAVTNYKGEITLIDGVEFRGNKATKLKEYDVFETKLVPEANSIQNMNGKIGTIEKSQFDGSSAFPIGGLIESYNDHKTPERASIGCVQGECHSGCLSDANSSCDCPLNLNHPFVSKGDEDLCYANPATEERALENGNTWASDFCRGVLPAFDYVAWPLNTEPSGLARALFKSIQGMDQLLDEQSVAIESFMGEKGSPCYEAFRVYACSSFHPQCRPVLGSDGLKPCGVCRNVCTEYMSKCSLESPEMLAGVLWSVARDYNPMGEVGLCVLNDVASAEDSVNRFFTPNCSTFDSEACTSTSTSTCIDPNDHSSSPVIAPSSTATSMDAQLGKRLRLRDRIGATTRMKQYTLIIDFQSRLVDGSALPNPNQRLLPFQTDARYKTTAFAKEAQEKFGNKRVSCVLSNPQDETNNVTCSLLGLVDGCPFLPSLDDSTIRLCGLALTIGQQTDNVDLRDELLVCPATFLNVTREQQLDSKLPRPLPDNHFRVALSVDLVSGYARAFANVGDGSGPQKVYDENWLLGYDDKEGFKLTKRGVLGTFLSPTGPLSLTEDLLVASVYSNVSSATLFSGAMPENDLNLLSGAPDSPTSFLVDFHPRRINLRESTTDAGASAEIVVRLLHRPNGTDPVRVALTFHDEVGAAERITVEQVQLSFPANKWQVPQSFRFIAVDDDRMQTTSVFTAELTSSSPTAWLNDANTVRLEVQDDDDVAALVARFSTSDIHPTNNSTNNTAIAASSKDNGVFRNLFPLPPEWVPDGFACKALEHNDSAAIASLNLLHGAPAKSYTLELGSEPFGPVRIAINVHRSEGGEPLLEAVPSSLTFLPSNWDVAQVIVLQWRADEVSPDESMSDLHTVQHELSSETDAQFASAENPLPFDLFAVKEVAPTSITTEKIPVELVAGCLSVVVAIAAILVWHIRNSSRKKVYHAVRKKTEALRAQKKAEEEKKEAEEEKMEAERKKSLAERENRKLRVSLAEAQKVVNKVMDEGGSLLDPYVIKYDEIVMNEKIGSFGTVFCGMYREMMVAIKTVRSTKVTEKAIQDFKSEIKIMAPLRHDNLIDLIGACWKDGPDKLCILLEFCGNGSLGDLLKSEHDLSWESPLYDIVLGIAQCFKYLHHDQAKDPLLHRDLKPDNVLLTDSLTPKVADFGESRRFDTETAIKHDRDELTMTLVGTPMYCAPEILEGLAYGASVDVYSFSILLLEVGIRAYPERNPRFSSPIDSSNHVRNQYCNVARDAVCNGWRPKPPLSLKLEHPKLLNLIANCWSDDPYDRPDFRSIVDMLECTLAPDDGRRRKGRTSPGQALLRRRLLCSDPGIEVTPTWQSSSLAHSLAENKNQCARSRHLSATTDEIDEMKKQLVEQGKKLEQLRAENSDLRHQVECLSNKNSVFQ